MVNSFACLVLGHYIIQTSQSRQRSALIVRLREYRSIAIQEISRSLQDDETKASNQTLFCVLSFLLAEGTGPLLGFNTYGSPSRTGSSPYLGWQHHLDGADALMEMRGGFPKELLSNTGIRPLLMYYLM